MLVILVRNAKRLTQSMSLGGAEATVALVVVLPHAMLVAGFVDELE